MRWMVCRVSDRITKSKESPSNSASPDSRLSCSTLTSFLTHASTLASSISTP